MEEMWKDIPGYEGIYQVSNMGNVRSLVFTNNQVKNKPRIQNMRPTDNGHGYLIVMLRKEGERKNFYVHRLVAEAFCKRTHGDVVDHIDYNKRNNAASNLEWCTQKENIHHSIEHYRQPKATYKTNTGEHYITYRGGKYRLCNKRLGIDKTYLTLEKAVQERNEVDLKWRALSNEKNAVMSAT